MQHDSPLAVIYVLAAPILSMRSTRLLDALVGGQNFAYQLWFCTRLLSEAPQGL